MKYIITFWKEREEKNHLLEFSEFEENCDLIRTIRYYKEITKIATPSAGSFGEWYENPDMSNVYSNIEEMITDMKNTEYIAIFSTKEEFESEWQKAISQPNFILKPYSEYTENDWNKLGKVE